MPHHDPRRCADCGSIMELRPNEEGFTELSLDQRYPPMVALLLTQVIEQNPPPDRRIDFLEGGRFIQWTDEKGELHRLDTAVESGSFDDFDDLDEEETELEAVDPEQLAAQLSKRGQA